MLSQSVLTLRNWSDGAYCYIVLSISADRESVILYA